MTRYPTAITLAVWLALALVPAGALAQGSTPLLQQGSPTPLTPFSNPGPTSTATSTPTTVSTSTTSSSAGGLSGTDGVAIGIGAILVLGGISFFIWRDARRRAPVRHRAAPAAAGAGTGPRQRQKNRKLSPAERRRRKRGRAR